MPKRPLITEATVHAAARTGRKQLVVPPRTLITPLARDAAREKGIAFVAEVVADDAPVSTTPTRPATRAVALGSDHGGFALKKELTPFIEAMGWRVIDVGTDSEASCDYPVFAYAVARSVALGQADYGVMIDGAGIGSAMVCNKVHGIRAACAYNTFTAWNARAHNDANVLTLGSRTLGIEVCKFITRTFLETAFEGGRHQRRVDMIGEVGARL